MLNGPKVTVCIPTYNRVDMLRASLQSVLYQSYQNIEVIVSDNASTDGTADYLQSLGDPRVTHDRLPENIGLFGNLTRCLHLGNGTYRVMLPDDDLMLPGNLERKVAFLEANPSAGMVHSAFRFLNEDSLPIGKVTNWARLDQDTLEPGRSFIQRSIIVGGMVCVPSVMLRSSVVADEQFDPQDGAYCDMALWLRVAARSDVGFLSEGLSGFLVHAGSASSGFQTVRVRRQVHQLTLHHADALRLAHGRFVDNYPNLSDHERAHLRRELDRADRNLRWALRANRWVPPLLLRGVKHLVGWRRRGPVHRLLALDAAYAPPPLEEQRAQSRADSGDRVS